VADLRKLGKRGSYRLGRPRSGERLGASVRRSRPGRVGRSSRRAMFGPQRSHVRPGWWLAVSVAGAVVIAVAAGLGLWFVPFVIGLVTGVAAPRAGWRLRQALPCVIVMAAAGWGIPLLWQAARGEPVGATARVITALAGLPPHAAIGVLVTLLVACLQTVAGLWLGRAVTRPGRSR
jgi:hypothetical protein